jgi:uncharacterized protein
MFETSEVHALCRIECLHLLSRASIGRIVVTAQALPAVQPVAFAMDGDAVVIATLPGSWLAAAAHNSIVAFQVDDIDSDGMCGWHVTAMGRAEVVTSVEVRSGYQLPRGAPPTADMSFVRVRLTRINGQRMGSHSAEPMGGPAAESPARGQQPPPPSAQVLNSARNSRAPN